MIILSVKSGGSEQSDLVIIGSGWLTLKKDRDPSVAVWAGQSDRLYKRSCTKRLNYSHRSRITTAGWGDLLDRFWNVLILFVTLTPKYCEPSIILKNNSLGVFLTEVDFQQHLFQMFSVNHLWLTQCSLPDQNQNQTTDGESYQLNSYI